DAQEGDPFTLSETVSVDATSAWLIHPSRPTSLSVEIDKGGVFENYDQEGLNVEAVSASSKESKANATVFDPPGARESVVNRFGMRPKPTWSLSIVANSWDSRDHLFGALKNQVPLLLRSPINWPWDLSDGWYSIGDVTDEARVDTRADIDRKSTRLNSSHVSISYAVFCLKNTNRV